MKIAYMMGTLNRGGTETLALDVCCNAAVAGLDMVLIHRKGGALAEDFRKSGVDMIELRPKSAFDLGYLVRLRQAVKDRKLDILHAHQVIDATYALLAMVGMPTKIVLSLHGHGDQNGFMTSHLRGFAIFQSNKILFVSEKLREHYIRSRGKITHGIVLHNGIDFAKFTPKSGVCLQKTLNLNPDQLLLGAVGNFTAVRDQLTICRFLSLLQKEGIPFHFVFIGAASKAEPELYQQCFDYCQTHDLVGRVSFLGSRCDVPALLPQLDAFVYSTLHDTFGIALVEAISAGIPVFVNDWKVMREVTNEGAWATLYASKNENDLLEKFLDFYHHQQQYREKARQSAAQVKKRYGIEKHLKNLKSIYASLLDG